MPHANATRSVARNALCNWAGMLTHLLTGFVVAPFLVHHLGQTGYGLWILIAALTSYFGALDLGVGGSVARNVAFLRAKNDRDGVNSLVSTALAILAGAALLAVLATLAAMPLFFVLFKVEPQQVSSARLALFLVGCQLAAWFVLCIGDGLLWAYQRFDVQNLVDIPTLVVRAGLTFWLIGQGGGLVTLAWITLGTSVASGILKLALCFGLDPGLRLGPSLIRRESARCLYGYGVWFFLMSLARTIAPQIAPQVIGGRLAVALVTPFSIATRLLGYASAFLISGSQVLAPVATGLYAAGQHDQQRRLFLEGGKYCLALALLFATLFVCLGPALILLWMGPDLSHAWILLVLLLAGELLPMSQWITYSMILAMSRHKLTACLNLIEGVLILGLSLLLVQTHGLVGVAVAVAIPSALCRGLGPMLYGCRLTGVPLAAYLRQVFAAPLLLAAGPAAALAAVVAWRPPTNWVDLFVYGGVYAIVYVAVVALGLLGRERVRRFLAISPPTEPDAAPAPLARNPHVA